MSNVNWTMEQVEEMLTQAYRLGWHAARYWPNVKQPHQLEFQWIETEHLDGTHHQVSYLEKL